MNFEVHVSRKYSAQNFVYQDHSRNLEVKRKEKQAGKRREWKTVARFCFMSSFTHDIHM